MNITQSRGMSLVELMVAVAILGIIVVVAVPTYQAYIDSGHAGKAEQFAQHIRGAQMNYYYDNETFLAGSYNPPGTNGLANTGWEPSGDFESYTYEVVAGPTGIDDSCVITVTYKDDTDQFHVETVLID